MDEILRRHFRYTKEEVKRLVMDDLENQGRKVEGETKLVLHDTHVILEVDVDFSILINKEGKDS